MTKSPVTALNEYFSDIKREKCGGTFLLALLISAAVMLVFVIMQGGYFTYYGDFNYQQLTFYYHVHEAVREGSFMWDFTTDLGTDLTESYSFYLLGSPFFWLTVPFPNQAVPFLIPWFLCLKTAVAAAAAYAYIRRFCQNTNVCCMGAMLYAFSGFQLTNIIFNHFHDATAVFPLLLIASDKLFTENKKGWFAAAVALCAVTNYFFFAGMAVFTVIYFAVNCITKRYRFTFKGFVNYGFEAVLGVLMAMVILLPSAAAVLATGRADYTLTLSEMFAYISDPMTYFYIFKSFFVFPELIVNPVFEISETLECASVSAYLPFVSLCGVIGYFCSRSQKCRTAALMTVICTVMMFIPVLNSAFYMFNHQYYARWFYMPILMMCVLTASAAEDDVMQFKKGLIPCAVGAALYAVIGMIYKTVTATFADTTYLALQLLLSAGPLALMYSMLSDKTLADNNARITALLKRVCVSCGVFMFAIIGAGKLTTIYGSEYIEGALKSRDNVESELIANHEDPESFFRVDVCDQFLNRNLMWDLSSNSSFISLINPSISEFYGEIEFPRNVKTVTPPDYESLRALFSVKYYFDLPLASESGNREPFPILNNAVQSFEYLKDVSGMHVYENNCYIPIGFAYDMYTTDNELDALDNRYFKCQAMLEALVLDEEQIARHGDILSDYDEACSRYDHEGLEQISRQKTAQSCEYFYTDSNGFDAKITLDSEKLVFFSIPYDESWSAQINGEPVEIEKVSYGFMAVRCPAGESEIRFDYVNKTVLYGMYISLAAAVIFIAYIAVGKIIRSNTQNDG